MISQSIVWAVLLIFMLAIFTQMIHYILPIEAKIEMNQLSRQYALLCEIQNGLTIGQTKELKSKLENRHFTEVQIYAPHIGELDLGEETEVIVRAVYITRESRGLFKGFDRNQLMEYKATVYGRKVFN